MSAVGTIALSAFVAGLLDIAATATVMTAQGVPIKRLLQFIASGALGSSAFDGGNRTAGVGLLFHFLIAAAAALIYYVASQGLIPVSLHRPVLSGVLYRIVVHLVMSRVVVPLSRAPKRKFSWAAFLTQLAIHMFCVGLPIASVQSSI